MFQKDFYELLFKGHITLLLFISLSVNQMLFPFCKVAKP